jgi:hypothetical protein
MKREMRHVNWRRGLHRLFLILFVAWVGLILLIRLSDARSAAIPWVEMYESQLARVEEGAKDYEKRLASGEFDDQEKWLRDSQTYAVRAGVEHNKMLVATARKDLSLRDRLSWIFSAPENRTTLALMLLPPLVLYVSVWLFVLGARWVLRGFDRAAVGDPADDSKTPA